MSTHETDSNLSAGYWLLAIGSLLWNLVGCVAFLTEVFNPEFMMESWTDEQREWASSFPVWVYWVYGIAVASGVFGSVCLILRRKMAIRFFGVCLVAVLIQMVYTMIIAGGFTVMGLESVWMPLFVICVAVALFVFSRRAQSKGWLA